MNSLLVVGLSVAGNYAVNTFIPILAETQVRGFPQPRHLGRLFNVVMDWAGHRSTAHHSTCRQQERVDM